MTADVVRPEQVAARMVARALDNATMPNPMEICDATGLSRPEIDTLIGKMIRVRNTGQAGRARRAKPPPGPEPAPDDPGQGGPPDDPARLVLWALSHPDQAVVAAALHAAEQLRGQIEGIIVDLADRARRERIEQLRAELAELEAVGKQVCQCGDLVTPDRMGVHLARSRKHRGEPTPAAP